MRYEIIKTENYLIILSDDEIKMNNYYYSFTERTIDRNYGNINEDDSVIEYELKKIIAHFPLNGADYLDGVDVLPPLEDDVEKLADEEFPDESTPGWRDSFSPRERRGFRVGYNKAKETYKYTEEDLAKCITFGWDLLRYHRFEPEEKLLKMQKDYIKFLQQPKLPIAFECEMIDVFKKDGEILLDDSGINQFHSHSKSPKTITNSQGITQWVGTYVY